MDNEAIWSIRAIPKLSLEPPFSFQLNLRVGTSTTRLTNFGRGELDNVGFVAHVSHGDCKYRVSGAELQLQVATVTEISTNEGSERQKYVKMGMKKFWC